MDLNVGGRQPRVLRFFAALVLLIVVSLGLGTVVPRPFLVFAPSGAANVNGGGKHTRTVLMLSSAIHTDLALPVDAGLVERFAFLAADGLDPTLAGAKHIVVGWGGRSFYIETPTWSDLKPAPLFRALTIDRSVMHVGLAGEIDPDHPSVTSIELGSDAFERLVNSVLASFTPDAGGAPSVVEGANYGDHDRFYEAEGWFNAVTGCNVWTARMLRHAGLKTGWWTPLPAMLATSLGLHNRMAGSAHSPAAR